MTPGKSDDHLIATTHNVARFFVEHRQVAWVLLVATALWGIFGYMKMPKRKDPVFPARTAVAVCVWPGVNAEKIEALVTRRIEDKIAENSTITKLESVVRTSVSITYFNIDERISDTSAQFDDVKLRLDGLTDLPSGTQPIVFLKDFADTAAMMLTVSSPPVSGVELDLKASAVQAALDRERGPAGAGRTAIVVSFPQTLDAAIVERPARLLATFLEQDGVGHDMNVVLGPGFAAIDGRMPGDDAAILMAVRRFIEGRLHASEFHPDVWQPTIVRDSKDARARLAAVAGDKYSYRDLDRFTDLIQKSVQTIAGTSKVTRSGVLAQQIYLDYSQQRLAAYGVHLATLPSLFAARNTQFPGGILEIGSKNITIDPSGELVTEREIGDMLAPRTAGVLLPLHLRDVLDISRDYESPAQFLNYYSAKGADGRWRRARAITVAIQMRQGEQIRAFGSEIDAVLAGLRQQLPPDLIIARTSDQPRQVGEIIDVFMRSLYEAIALVVVIAAIGFWEWRSALLLALSIPITLSMTLGLMAAFGLDLQQSSIGSLIIALGLLVDDPVVANDAIKRELADGKPRAIAAWLGPTKLGRAILFATITNIAAYVPLLLLSGDLGRFIYSIPVVLACSLIASRVVSMTFVPVLAYYLLRPDAKARVEPRAQRGGFAMRYARTVRWALEHRGLALLGGLLIIAMGGVASSRIKSDFFPKDLSYLSYVDLWLPTDAPLSATNALAGQTERVVQQVAEKYGVDHPGPDGKPRQVLASVTSFVGGGGPRFWFSVAPEVQQLNYAQVLIEVLDKHDTRHLLPELQHALSGAIAGARVDVRELEVGKPVGIPVAVRVSGSDVPTLRRLAEEAKGVFRAIPIAMGTRDDWGEESFTITLKVDQERANDAGVSNFDVALASAAAMNGATLTKMREGDQEIPVVLRLRMEDRAQIGDVQSLIVTSGAGNGRAMLRQVSNLQYGTETEKLRRRDHFRTITIATFPVPGALPSEVMTAARPALTKFAASLPPGYSMAIGGSEEEQNKGFGEMAFIMATSVGMIFLALVIQFNHAFKPVLVFATIPFGVVGALVALAIMGTPFGFMAFLGVASLVGVIVSHVIVLFDFIEEMREKGEPLEDALIDAGIVRLRPVLITVGATVFALFPLAAHGGPFWEPLCFAQIGGLIFATIGTLFFVPVLYFVSVRDLKVVKWEEPHPGAEVAV